MDQDTSISIAFVTCVSSCMDDRGRSRSRERDTLVGRFFRIRAERRGGKSFRRRYRAVCLQLLDFLLNLINGALDHQDTDLYHPSSVSLQRMSDRMSEDMSERMSEDLSERMSEDLSERIAEDMSDRMSEDVRKNVKQFARRICQK